MDIFSRLANGLGFIFPFFRETYLIWLSSVIGIFISKNRQMIFFFLISFTLVLWQIWTGGDPWNYWRIIAPGIPFLLIVYIHSVKVIIDYIKVPQLTTFILTDTKKAFQHTLNIRLLITSKLVIAPMSILNSRFFPEITLTNEPYNTEANRINFNISLVLKKYLQPNATIGVFNAGTIPYNLISNRAIDFLGKANVHIANLPPDKSGSVSWLGMKSVPGHNKYNLNYSIKTLKPTYVEDCRWGNQKFREWCMENYIKITDHDITILLRKDQAGITWKRYRPDTPSILVESIPYTRSLDTT